MDYLFLAMFTKSKAGAVPANAPTIDVINAATDALVVTAGNPTALANMAGMYRYTYSGAADLQLIGLFKTADTTVDLQQVPSYTPQQTINHAAQIRTELATELARVDVATSTRLASASYTTPPTAMAVADEVRVELATELARIDDEITSRADAASYTPARAAKLDLLGAAGVTVASPVASDGTAITLIYGDDYYSADGRALAFTGTNWPTLTGGTVNLRIQTAAGVVSIAGTVTGVDACRFDVTKTQVESIGIGVWRYDLEASLVTSLHIATLVQGYLTVAQDVR